MPNYSVVRVQAYLRLANSVFAGYTDWGATYGGGSLNLGTAWVNVSADLKRVRGSGRPLPRR